MKKIFFMICLLLMINVVSAGKVNYKFAIYGQSMYPAINNGLDYSILSVTMVNDKNDIVEDDIICFNHDHRDYINGGSFRYICHRLVKYNYPEVCTKGDNNIEYDNCVRFSDVAFKVYI